MEVTGTFTVPDNEVFSALHSENARLGVDAEIYYESWQEERKLVQAILYKQFPKEAFGDMCGQESLTKMAKWLSKNKITK